MTKATHLRNRSGYQRAATMSLMIVTAGGLPGCVDALSWEAPVDAPMEPGDSRTFELRFLRFDVSNYERTLTREDLLALPEETQRRLWLLDLDLSNSPGSPRFIENAITEIRDADPATLSQSARNLQGLLNMTPDSANLEGTSFESLIELAPIIGVAPARALADLVNINVEDRFLPTTAIADTLLRDVVGSHPAAQLRQGPRTAENPEGLYPVTPQSLPITLADAASDFATFAETFGETLNNGVYHPGFVTGDVSASILGPDFSITVRANANALPFKGIDLSQGETGSVNSIESQIDSLFNFDDPNWLVIRGLVAGTPVISEITFQIVEDDLFHPGGSSPLPRPQGDSQAWLLAPWTLEHVILESSLAAFQGLNSSTSYSIPGNSEPVFSLSVEDGWSTVTTQGGVGSPPAPRYIWDVLLEIAQVRLHDGGIAEGDGDVTFTLRDVPVGIDTRTIERTIRENLESDPSALLPVAETIIDNSDGAPDFYYTRAVGVDGTEGNWLYFIAEEDIPTTEEGLPERPWDYARPGFFADPDLLEQVSSREGVPGETLHEKVQVQAGDTFYVQDDVGGVYRLDITGAPGRSTIAVSVERIR
jgi:hypothetical protein